MSNTEFQETLSVNEVRKFCALSNHLSGQDISYNDKTISWDGNIIYYSEKRDQARKRVCYSCAD